MTTSLRAFFLVRTAQGDWEITVFHTLEEVLRAWESLTHKTAVLHVGFERRIAKSFEALASQFPGKVLLTPGARGALPSSFSSSRHPIGVVGDEPIFLALEGWGYSAIEPAQPDSALEGPRPSGWVASFVANNLDMQGRLVDWGIFDEDSYIKNEAGLDAHVRTQLALFRSQCLVGETRDDPTALARHAPPWLKSLDLTKLGLTVRIANVFRKRSMTCVGDIGKLTIPELLSLQNFGRTSVAHLVEILERELAAGPRQEIDIASLPVDETLIGAVRRSLANCTDRERDILTRRMGLDCDPCTLAEIGEFYGVTRERIRQIEAKVVERLVRQDIWDDILAAKLHNMLVKREFPLPLVGAEAIDPWFAGVAGHREAVRYLIANMCDAAVSLIEINGIEYLSFLSQDAWGEIITTARQLLASGVQKRWTKDDCRQHVMMLVPGEAREFGSILWEIASKWCHFADEDGASYLISYGRGVNQVVEALLFESETPLHYSEITTLASARSGRELEERRVHNAAAEVAYLFGPGTYGMVKHLCVSREKWESYAEEAAEIVTEDPTDRQWHASELVDCLRQRDVEVPECFDKYQMDIALKQSCYLQTLGRMVWIRNDGANESVRVDIRQAVIATLQSAGGPLNSADLRQRVIAIRGINYGMQFQVIDPIIKLDAQTWALNDRDIDVKRAEQTVFLDDLVATLRAWGKPVHISECTSVVGSTVPARAVFCLASLDARLRTTTDRCLALAEWG